MIACLIGHVSSSDGVRVVSVVLLSKEKLLPNRDFFN